MKTFVIVVASFIVALWIFSQGSWHINRNQHNKLPTGTLTQTNAFTFEDSLGLIWVLQPKSKNELHQPKIRQEKPNSPYPNVKGSIVYDRDYPNLKFTCMAMNGCSYEAILQPNGKYLRSGAARGTFNYEDANGFLGNIRHFFVDLAPHLLNSNYE